MGWAAGLFAVDLLVLRLTLVVLAGGNRGDALWGYIADLCWEACCSALWAGSEKEARG